MRFSRDNLLSLTTAYTTITPDFVISIWGVYIVSGTVLVEVYDGSSWVRGQIGNAEEILSDNYDCTKIRMKATTGTAEISYSLEGRKEFGSGSGDMFKSVYDTDDDGIVDQAEVLNDGTNVATAEEVRNHMDNSAIHREINYDADYKAYIINND